MQATLSPTSIQPSPIEPSSIQPSPIQEDALAFLPCSPISEYGPGEIVYAQGEASTTIYLIIEGKVKISRKRQSGEVVVDLFQADDFFGESALAGGEVREESASALEKTRAMSWSRDEFAANALARPRLAIAFAQIAIRRLAESARRIESLSTESVPVRLRGTLLRFAERFGVLQPDGSVQMTAFTHELLSQYVGTSRELVTHHMSRLRREGFLEYSREGITIRSCAFTEWR